LIVTEVGYKGILVFDTVKLDGAPRKLMDNSKINKLGWQSSINLQNGIKQTINEFKNLF
jgi:GDP-L-fucose synthase